MNYYLLQLLLLLLMMQLLLCVCLSERIIPFVLERVDESLVYLAHRLNLSLAHVVVTQSKRVFSSPSSPPPPLAPSSSAAAAASVLSHLPSARVWSPAVMLALVM